MRLVSRLRCRVAESSPMRPVTQPFLSRGRAEARATPRAGLPESTEIARQLSRMACWTLNGALLLTLAVLSSPSALPAQEGFTPGNLEITVVASPGQLIPGDTVKIRGATGLIGKGSQVAIRIPASGRQGSGRPERGATSER